MGIKVTSKFTKKDSSTGSYSNSGMNALIDTYFDAGKITQKPVKKVNDLVETYTTVFKDMKSLLEFTDETANTDNDKTRDQWCKDNNVSYERSNVEE